MDETSIKDDKILFYNVMICMKTLFSRKSAEGDYGTNITIINTVSSVEFNTKSTFSTYSTIGEHFFVESSLFFT